MRLPEPGLLRDRGFRNLFAAVTVAAVGAQVSNVALPLVAVLVLNASEFEVGLLSALPSAALVALGLPAGAWVDRMRRRRVLIVNDLVRAVILVSVPIAWWFDMLTITQLCVVAGLIGVFSVFFDVASQSFLPTLVGREHLVEANSKQESIRQVAQLGGPAVAGQVVAWLTAPISLLITSISMALSALFVTRVDVHEVKAPKRPDASLRRDIGEGLRFVLGSRLLRAMGMSTAWCNFFAGAYMAMTMVFMARTLELSPGMIGVVMSVGGIGGIIGALTARRFAELFGQGPTMWIVFAVGMPFELVLPLVGSGWTIWLAAAAGIVPSFAVTVYNITMLSARQQMAPDHLQGRVNATMRFVNWCTLPVGSLLGGVLGSWIGARETLLYMGLGSCLAFVPLVLSPLRTMRELPKAPEDQASLTTAS